MARLRKLLYRGYRHRSGPRGVLGRDALFHGYRFISGLKSGTRDSNRALRCNRHFGWYFFGVKAGSDAAPGAHDLASSAMVTGTTQLAVVSVEPPQGATGVPAATLVTATFSKDMNPTTNTFRLAVRDTGALVPGGRVRYDPLTRKAIFTLVLL